MQVEINWLAVVLATLSSMAIGSIWYMPKVFGKTWMKLARIDFDPAKRKGVWKPILVTLIVSFVTAYILAHVTYLSHYFFGTAFQENAITTAFWVWLGFTAARFITHDAFEGRPIKLTAINVAHEFVTIMVMGMIIGLLPPDFSNYFILD